MFFSFFILLMFVLGKSNVKELATLGRTFCDAEERVRQIQDQSAIWGDLLNMVKGSRKSVRSLQFMSEGKDLDRVKT